MLALSIFNLGLPGLILQLTAPEETRAEIRRNMWRIVPGVLWLMAWLLCATVALVALNMIIPAWTPAWADRAVLITVFSLIATGYVWYFHINRYSPERLASILGRRLTHSWGGELAPAEEARRGLYWLGTHGRSSSEKRAVLKEIHLVISVVQGRRGYDGTQLGQIVTGIEPLLCNPTCPGGDDELAEAGLMLSRARKRILAIGQPASADHVNAVKVLRVLGVEAINRGSKQTAYFYLGALGDNAQALFDLGLASIAAGRQETARAALHRLECVAEAQGMMGLTLETAEMLGLLSHYWCSQSGAMKSIARSYIELRSSEFSPDVWSCLEFARDYHLCLLRYPTVDSISSMLSNLPSSPSPGVSRSDPLQGGQAPVRASSPAR
jgi:hypothetical protein